MKKIIAIFITVCFLSTVVIPREALAQGVFGLPAPGAMVSVSPNFVPTLLRGIKIYPDNPLKFDFMVDSGNTGLSGAELQKETEKNIRYFLTSLTMPEKDMWVNLSPHEEDRIIPDSLAQTELGRDMLAQDYFLKQITASLIYPEDDLGKKFWSKVYKKAYEQYGTTNIPVNTFNKVWIVPDKALVFQDGDTAYLTDVHLQVMLEQDYLAMTKSSNYKPEDTNSKSLIASEIMREIVIPEIEKEINEGKNFAPLRQLTYAWALATWFKNNLKQSFLNRVYVDQKKILGVNIEDKKIKEKIYDQYLKAFQKGVCDYVKIEYDQYTNKNIPRKYFSGGLTYRGSSVIVSDLKKIRKQLDDFSVRQIQRFDQFSEKASRWARDSRISIASMKMEIADNFSAMFSNRQSIMKTALTGILSALSLVPSMGSNQQGSIVLVNGAYRYLEPGESIEEISGVKTAVFGESNLGAKDSDENDPYEDFSKEQQKTISKSMAYINFINDLLVKHGLKIYLEKKTLRSKPEAIRFTIREEGEGRESKALAALDVQVEDDPFEGKERLFLRLRNLGWGVFGVRWSSSGRIFSEWTSYERNSREDSQGFFVDKSGKGSDKLDKGGQEIFDQYIAPGLFLNPLSSNPDFEKFFRACLFGKLREFGFSGTSDNNDVDSAAFVKVQGDNLVFPSDKNVFFDTIQFAPENISVDFKADEVQVAIGVDWTGSITKEMAEAQRQSLIDLANQLKEKEINNIRISVAVVGKKSIEIPESMSPQELLDFLEKSDFLRKAGYGNTPFIEKLDSLSMSQPEGALIYFPTDAWQDYATDGNFPLSADEILALRVGGKDIFQIIDQAGEKGQEIYILNVGDKGKTPPLIKILREYNAPHVHIQESDYKGFGDQVFKTAQPIFSISFPENVAPKDLTVSLLGEKRSFSFRADGTQLGQEEGSEFDRLLETARAEGEIKQGGALNIDSETGEILVPSSILGKKEGTLHVVAEKSEVPIVRNKEKKTLVLVIDASGSYESKFKRDLGKLKERLTALHETCIIPGLVVIADGKVKSINTYNLKEQIKALDNEITPGSNTPNFQAIDQAVDMLVNSMDQHTQATPVLGVLGDLMTTDLSGGDDFKTTLRKIKEKGIHLKLMGSFGQDISKMYEMTNEEIKDKILDFDIEKFRLFSMNHYGRALSLLAQLSMSSAGDISKMVYLSKKSDYFEALDPLLDDLIKEDQIVPIKDGFVPEKVYFVDPSGRIIEFDVEVVPGATGSVKQEDGGSIQSETKNNFLKEVIVIDQKAGTTKRFYDMDGELVDPDYKEKIDEINEVIKENYPEYRDGYPPQYSLISAFEAGNVYYEVNGENYKDILSELKQALSGGGDVRIFGAYTEEYEDQIGQNSGGGDASLQKGSSIIDIMPKNTFTPRDSEVGGIRLDAQGLDIQTQGDMLDFSSPEGLDQISPDQIPGFIPTIISIIPVINLSSAEDLFDQIPKS
ncbi:MAG: VWA domain-containing protein [Candidatus Omnitrophica bacterium]|nr:VWA domain-containing protein [Candidatus Omnitrophota bacterium]